MTEDRSLSAEEAETARRIYCAYKNKMFSIALGILHDSHDAEDAVSESVVRIIKNIDRFKGADERLVKAGVLIYTRSAALNLYNRKKRLSAHEESAVTETDDGFEEREFEDIFADVQLSAARDDEKERILICLGRLGQRDRDLLTLVCSLGYSYKETSEITGMTVSNVGSALKRAKERLRKELENEGII